MGRGAQPLEGLQLLTSLRAAWAPPGSLTLPRTHRTRHRAQRPPDGDRSPAPPLTQPSCPCCCPLGPVWGACWRVETTPATLGSASDAPETPQPDLGPRRWVPGRSVPRVLPTGLQQPHPNTFPGPGHCGRRRQPPSTLGPKACLGFRVWGRGPSLGPAPSLTQEGPQVQPGPPAPLCPGSGQQEAPHSVLSCGPWKAGLPSAFRMPA